MRWQQFTGPVMAKGLEDTASYRFNPLLSLNEVGAHPGGPESRFGIKAFHRLNAMRGLRWPHTLNATSTHDTKRSEDVRARIDVLSEIPREWERHARRWRRINRSAKRLVEGRLVPDAKMELLLYQTILGAWPLERREIPGFRRRLGDYGIKAAREAKLRTSWLRPEEGYERALAAFIEGLLADPRSNPFLREFLPFQKKIAYYGALNSLAQVLLKIASPGVPDFYQGQETWNFSLVDPDNRRPVDFSKGVRLLQSLADPGGRTRHAFFRDILSRWHDGRIKLYVTARGLQFRRRHRRLFQEGDYVPIRALGPRKEHLCAFARRKGREWILVAVPRLCTKLVDVGEAPIGSETWGSLAFPMPHGMPRAWTNVLTGERLHVSSKRRQGAILASDALRDLPVALLQGRTR